MGTVGSHADTSLSWHSRAHIHPIFSPEYARENLVSLAETLVILYFYFVIFILLLHYFVLLGYIQPQTIPWMLIEASLRNFLNQVPASMVENKGVIVFSILTTVLAVRLTRYSFDILKAEMHPEDDFKKEMVYHQIPVTKERISVKRHYTKRHITLTPTW